MDDTLWDNAGAAAVQVAEYMHGFALVQVVLTGHRAGLTDDQIAEAIKPLLDQAREDFAADVAHYRRELMAAATTRARVQ